MASGWIDMEGEQIAASFYQGQKPNYTVEIEPDSDIHSHSTTTTNDHHAACASGPRVYIRTFFWTLVFGAFIQINWMFQNFKALFREPSYKSVPANDISRASSLRKSYVSAIGNGYTPKTRPVVVDYQPVFCGGASTSSVTSSLHLTNGRHLPLLSDPPSMPCSPLSDTSLPHTEDSGVESDDVFTPLRGCKSLPPRDRRKKHSGSSGYTSSSSAEVFLPMPQSRISGGSCSTCGGNPPAVNIYFTVPQNEINIRMDTVAGTVNIAQNPALVPAYSHQQEYRQQAPQPLRSHDIIYDPTLRVENLPQYV